MSHICTRLCVVMVANFFYRPVLLCPLRQALDGYFNSVCELDLVFSLHKSLMSKLSCHVMVYLPS